MRANKLAALCMPRSEARRVWALHQAQTFLSSALLHVLTEQCMLKHVTVPTMLSRNARVCIRTLMNLPLALNLNLDLDLLP